MSADMASSDERLQPGHYARQPSDYVRPAFPLRFDGTVSWYARTGWDNNVEIIQRLPAGAEIVVEAVPEPGNPHDHTAVALDVDGMRVGYVRRWLAASLFPAIVEANKAGFYVLMQAKRHTALSARGELEVRSSNGADLRAWLLVPQDRRGTTFFELDWRKCGRQFAYQDQLSAVMGDADESQLFECDFVPSPRKDGRAHADADVFVAGIHVGELGNYGGQGTGFARFHKWPDNIEMKVLAPLADSTWPLSTQPFMWKGGSTT
jgi:hypothetical protein